MNTPDPYRVPATLALRPRRQRATEAWEFPGIGHLSKDKNMRNGRWLIEQLMSLTGDENLKLWDDLEKGTTDEDTYAKRHGGRKHRVGRDRVDGHWAPIGCAWLLAKRPEISFFLADKEDSRIWESAGFKDGEPPSYWTVRDRLLELHHYRDAFVTANAKLWRNAMRLDPRVGRHIVVDACFYESHSRLHHQCLDKEACKAHGGKQVPEWIERESVEEVEAERHRAQKEAPPEEEEHEVTVDPWDYENDLEEEAVAICEDGADDDAVRPHPKYEKKRRERRPVEARDILIRWNKNDTYKHRYVCRDGDAGFRLYEKKNGRKKKTNTGGLFLQATCAATGGVVASLHIAADEQEFNHLDELLDRVRAILGYDPEVVIGDRAYAIKGLKLACARRGIHLMTPFRKANGAAKRRDLRIEGVVDEYGVPYCKHCGSPGTTLGSKRGSKLASTATTTASQASGSSARTRTR